MQLKDVILNEKGRNCAHHLKNYRSDFKRRKMKGLLCKGAVALCILTYLASLIPFCVAAINL